MSTDTVLEQIFKDMITLGDPIDPTADREQYENWDSLANMNLMMAINGEFGDIITLDDLDNFRSFAVIEKMVQDRA